MGSRDIWGPGLGRGGGEINRSRGEERIGEDRERRI